MKLEAENYLGYIYRVYTPITENAKTELHTKYAVDIGIIHCVFLDDYAGSRGTNITMVGAAAWLANRNAQLEWVKSDPESVDRSVTPWVVVIKHNSYYNTWSNLQCRCSSPIFEINEDDVDKCWNDTYYSGIVYSQPQCGQMAKWEEAFSANDVNAMIMAHVHVHERTVMDVRIALFATVDYWLIGRSDNAGDFISFVFVFDLYTSVCTYVSQWMSALMPIE
ncbi:hypothetical protein F444_06011 [Phytophthora nicotianae P1976]|uniref:Uncharacterized protein n=1 Tax=Phytophthora nicotianae P1976 TaxID=1317066 RepID=A0A081AK43_PHYNI|nr:hypothetical protein F444_06011 [Phytophthora nicotianae P1976]